MNIGFGRQAADRTPDMPQPDAATLNERSRLEQLKQQGANQIALDPRMAAAANVIDLQRKFDQAQERETTAAAKSAAARRQLESSGNLRRDYEDALARGDTDLPPPDHARAVALHAGLVRLAENDAATVVHVHHQLQGAHKVLRRSLLAECRQAYADAAKALERAFLALQVLGEDTDQAQFVAPGRLALPAMTGSKEDGGPGLLISFTSAVSGGGMLAARERIDARCEEAVATMRTASVIEGARS